MRNRRLAPGSTRDSAWQAEEYQRLMGEEAAERQKKAMKLEAGDCTCKRVTIKTRGVFRTIHEQGCVKWKPYMEEHREQVEQQRRDGKWTPS